MKIVQLLKASKTHACTEPSIYALTEEGTIFQIMENDLQCTRETWLCIDTFFADEENEK